MSATTESEGITTTKDSTTKDNTTKDCIFCKIATKEIPAKVVYENDRVIAFDDLYPQAPVHVLVIPKKHYVSISDDVSDEDLLALFRATEEIAKIKGIDQKGYRLVINNGKDAGQTVFHFHIHVMGGTNLMEDNL